VLYGGPKEKPLLDTKYIKKAMAKESEASSKIKLEVVAILV
jgi:hypothetical protein